MDFGLAKEELDTSITVHGTILGTPCYISPEQARGEINVDIRSDIYSLGITLFHLLVGEPPFCEFNTTLMLTKKTTDPVPAPKILNPDLSDEISYITEKMSERDAENRYKSPNELIKDLEDYLAGRLKVPEQKPRKAVPATTRKKAAVEKGKTVKDVLAKLNDPTLSNAISCDAIPGECIKIDPGRVLFYESDLTRDAYIFVEGELEVLKAGRRIVAIADPGTFVGEMATLLNCPRTATVRALRPSTLVRIREEDFKRFLTCIPEIGYRLAVNLAKNLHRTTNKLKEFQSRTLAIRNYLQLMSEELDSQ
jgi:hypothetical protein